MVALAAFANTALSWRLESNGAACNEPESHGQVFYSTSYNFAQCRDNCRDRNGDSFSFRASPQACRCNAGRTGSRHIEQNWQCYSMDSPTWVPTVEPTQTPTDEPSSHPTLHPSSSPSLNPTTDQPSQNPTMYSPYTYNDPVISNGFYCGHGASGAVAGYRLLRTFNGNEAQCKAECGNDVDCMVFTMPIAHADYECRGSPSAAGPCCFLIYVDNAPREAPSNSICPNSAGGYARAANSYRLWAKKTQATRYTYNDPVISNGFYCGHGASGAVAGYRFLRTFNGNEEQCKAECGNDVDCMVFTMPIANVDYECRGSLSASGPCCYLIY